MGLMSREKIGIEIRVTGNSGSQPVNETQEEEEEENFPKRGNKKAFFDSFPLFYQKSRKR